MVEITEIFLLENNATSENWLNLINVISKYVGYFKKWELLVKIENSQIRFFINSDIRLPATIDGIDDFILKDSSFEEFDYNFALPRIIGISENLINLIDKYEIKNKGNIKYIEFSFRKIFNDKVISKSYIYYERNDRLYKARINSIPSVLLRVDKDKNKRFTFKEVPKYLDINKSLHLLSSDKNNAILNIDTFPYLQGNFYIKENSYDFAKHSVIFGASGCGKSKFISLLINNIYKNNDLKNQYKVVVIDPHAALEQDIGGLGKTIDFKSNIDSIDLFKNNSDDVVATTEILLDLFKVLIADQFNSKLERVLRHSVYLLLSEDLFDFTNLRNLLLEADYRNELINNGKNILPSSVIDFFLTDFNDLKVKSYGEAISPIIGFIDELQMLPVFNNKEKLNTLEQTIKDNFLTILSLDRIKLGDKITKTISGLVMQQLLTLIQKYAFDNHIIFIIDEVAVVENPILARFLSEARKYNLSLFLAGQYFNQISEELKNAIFANVINYYIFRVSRLDAEILVNNFNMKVPIEDTIARKVKILSEQSNRECIVRIANNGIILPAMKAKTLDFTSIPRVKQNDVTNNSGENVNNGSQKINFRIGSNINLHDILKENSTNRKEDEQ